MNYTEYAIARCGAQAAERVNAARIGHRAIELSDDDAQEAGALIQLALSLPDVQKDRFVQESRGVQLLLAAQSGLKKRHGEDS